MDDILKVSHLTKQFTSGTGALTVLSDVNFAVMEKSGMAIVGPSGSGKTTLLGLCAGLDTPTSGSVALMGMELNRLDEDDRAYVRNQFVGFVFQNFQLLPTLTALENVMVPMELRGGKNIKPKAMELLGRVGLGDRAHHYPSQLSGGEQQRVAIARAFMADPKILFADEPTGNLDEETAETVRELLFQLHTEQGATLVLVTHNMQLAENTGRILQLKGGKLVADRSMAPSKAGES